MARGSIKQSITALPSFLNWSFEELRLHDYSIGNRGPSAATTSGVGVLSSIGAGFQDTSPNTNLESITAKLPYMKWSFEELRLQDYSLGIRGGSPSTAQGLFRFGSSSAAGAVSRVGVPTGACGCQATNDAHAAASTVNIPSIPAMSPFLDYSFEELRLHDYLLAKRGFASLATGARVGTALALSSGSDLLLSPPSPLLPDMDESAAATPTPLFCFGVGAAAFEAVPYMGRGFLADPRNLLDVRAAPPSGISTKWPASVSLFGQAPTAFCVAPTKGHFVVPPPPKEVDDPMPCTPLRPWI
jgi:hypothetical protein